MTEELKKVENFYKAFNIDYKHTPSEIDSDRALLRHKLMSEENDEYLEGVNNKDIVEIADALGDQLYILCGTILEHGLQHIIEDVFSEIQKSNMSKLGADGKPVIRDDGKIMKGPGYFKPNIKEIIS